MKYTVNILEVYSITVDVEADDEHEARNVAESYLDADCDVHGDSLPESTHDYTLSKEKWGVWKA